MGIEYRILGPVQAVRDGEPVPLGGPRQRAVLARLLLDRGRVVPAGVLADDVWGGDPPESAAKTLQKYVSELRKRLGDGALRTDGRGYRLPAGPDDLDAARAERLVADGDAAAALELWRGEPLDYLPDLPFVAAERSRLAELRLGAEEHAAEAALAEGRHREVVARLHRLAAAHPEREHLCGLLMTALYRSGRQVEALAAFRRHRERLADELGVEPAAELVALQAAVLRHDEELAVRPPATGAPEQTAPGRAGAPERPAPGRPAGNLRAPVSSFVGRDREVRATVAALRDPGPVTLTGPGGVGKTRLAVETAVAAATDFPGGTWLVDLAGLGDPGQVVHEVATAVVAGDRADRADEDEQATLLALLAHRGRLLLVLDNCEHLLARLAVLVDAVARACPETHVLVTSRRPLGVDGERVVVLPPLAEADARQLFEDRVRRAGATEDDLARLPTAEICRRLDGLPLAVELTAAQVRVLGPEEVAARLDTRLGFASPRFDAGPRQRSLADAVAWSYELLPADTRDFFGRLGVFASTLTLEAAGEVCGPDSLEHVGALVQHSLLAREQQPHAPARFRLLETLRLYATERLREAGREDEARCAHARYYLRLVRAAGPHLHGPHEEHWLARLAAEEPNLHAAMDWAAEHDAELALALGSACRRYWSMTWQERLAFGYLGSVVAGAGAAAPAPARAWALATMADVASRVREARQARPCAEEAIALFRGTADRRGLLLAQVALGRAACAAGDVDEADQLLQEARREAHGRGEADRDPDLAADLAGLAFFVAERRDDLIAAERWGREEEAIWRSAGSRRGAAVALGQHVAQVLQRMGRLDEAAAALAEALAVWRGSGHPADRAHAQVGLADVLRERGDAAEAERIYREALDVLRRCGDRRCVALVETALAALAADRSEPEEAGRLYRDAARLRHELGDSPGLAECLTGLAAVHAAEQRYVEAAVLLAAADERHRAGGAPMSAAEQALRARLAATLAVVPPPAPDAPAPTLADILGIDIPVGG